MEERLGELAGRARERLGDGIGVLADPTRAVLRLACPAPRLREVCAWLAGEAGLVFATLVVEEEAAGGRSLTYLFHHASGGVWAHAEVRLPDGCASVPTISDRVHAADWHEREAEDLFGLAFEGHPRLGEFVLHEHWPEGVNPMRPGFDAHRSPAPEARAAGPEWSPPTIVEAPGAFAMPIGPVFSDFAEAARFVLETVGEDVIVTHPRLFYKFRGVEKRAEGLTADRALLLAERFSGSFAFAHGLAFCQAVERVCEAEVPPRARALRTLLAETERLRAHVAAIAAICGSTALAVAQSQAAILEEDLLRLTGEATGHRYLFGLLEPGGLSRDPGDEACRRLAGGVGAVARRLARLRKMLRYSSSFLDRLEEVGVVGRERALDFGLVGPVARGAGVARDLRVLFPYAGYAGTGLEVPVESEGDGYARLRVLFREAFEARRVVERVAADLPAGPVSAGPLAPRAGAALGWAEAPAGATFHWVRLDDQGRVARYRVTTPSFANWHGFHLAAENFAFQDFPIILASFGLSNAECDR